MCNSATFSGLFHAQNTSRYRVYSMHYVFSEYALTLQNRRVAAIENQQSVFDRNIHNKCTHCVYFRRNKKAKHCWARTHSLADVHSFHYILQTGGFSNLLFDFFAKSYYSVSIHELSSYFSLNIKMKIRFYLPVYVK